MLKDEGSSTRKKGVWAKIISFDLGAKGSKKVKFYRQLFGYYTSKRRGNRLYRTYVPGLLSTIPHLALGKSVIAVPPGACEQILSFLSKPEWKPIEIHVVDGLLTREQYREALRSMLEGPVRLSTGELELGKALLRKGSLPAPDREFLSNLEERVSRFGWRLKDAL